MADHPLPSDVFSRTLRAAQDHPDSLGAGSTIHARDFYGNSETWVVETYRADGRDLVFLQHNAAGGGTRFVLPAEVTAALARHREQLTNRSRRRAARAAVQTRRLRGDAIGNPAALQQALTRRRRGGAK